MPQVGIVIIGRNEGQRLHGCIRSVQTGVATAVYVDSGSIDGSVAAARSYGIDVLELDSTLPFSAARARNDGMARLLALDPTIEFVQFVDGDCEMDDQWIAAACSVLMQRSEVAAVGGWRRECAPEASIYNRLCDLEWRAPTGEVTWLGGDLMMRVRAFQEVGGYDASVRAGEEPELCSRLRRRNWKVLRVDHPMTRHDVQLRRFSQWWRRQIRSGYGGMDVAFRFGMPEFMAQLRSAWVWVLLWPLAVTVAVVIPIWMRGSLATYIPAFVLALALPAQMLRIAWATRRAGQLLGAAIANGWLTMLSKLAQVMGHSMYARDRIFGRRMRLVEYKNVTQRAG